VTSVVSTDVTGSKHPAPESSAESALLQFLGFVGGLGSGFLALDDVLRVLAGCGDFVAADLGGPRLLFYDAARYAAAG
jgi:hypothetical protein